MARKRRRPSKVPLGTIALLVAIPAIPLILWLRRRSASATMVPSGPMSPTLPPSPPPETPIEVPLPPAPLPSEPYMSNETQRTVALLRSSDQARQIYYFQSTLYSYGFTNEKPDGVYGPITTGMARRVNETLGLRSFTSWNPQMVARGVLAMNQIYSSGNLRAIPDRLPVDVVRAINATAMAAGGAWGVPSPPLLQARS